MKNGKVIWVILMLFAVMSIACTSSQEDSDRIHITSWNEKQIAENVVADFSLEEDYENSKTGMYLVKDAGMPSDEYILKLRSIYFPEDCSDYKIMEEEELFYPAKTLETEAGGYIGISPDGKAGHTSMYNLYLDFMGMRGGSYGIPELIENVHAEEELSFMSRSEAESLSRQVICQSIEEPIEIDSIDVEACTTDYFRSLIKAYEKKGYINNINPSTLEHKWDKEDEIYIVKVAFSCDDLPLEQEMYSQERMQIMSSYAELYLHDSGFLSFEIMGRDLLGECKEREILSCEEALQVIATKYDNIITMHKLKIIKGILQYEILSDSSKGKNYLTPVWKFTVEKMAGDETKGTQTVISEEFIHVNAVTGEIIE